MNWIFEAYSNVYNTAMGQKAFHHQGSRTMPARQQPNRVKGERNFF